MIYTVKPIAAKLLAPGDLFRDGGQTLQIADVERDENVVEITYFTGTRDFVNSFFLSPDDTLDKVVGTAGERTLVLKKEVIRALSDELLNINRAINSIIRIASDNGVDPFQDQ